MENFEDQVLEPTVEPVQPEPADDAQDVAVDAEQPAQQEDQGYISKEQYEARIRSITANAVRQGRSEAMAEFINSPEQKLARRLAEIYPDKTVDQILDEASTMRAQALAAQLDDNPQEVIKQLLAPKTAAPAHVPQVTPQMLFQRAAQEAQAALVPAGEWNTLVNRPDFQEAIMRGDSYHAARSIVQLNDAARAPKQNGNPPPSQTMKNAQRVAVSDNPVANMTDDQIREISERVERGERVVP